MTLARLLPRGNLAGSLYGIVLVTSILVTFVGSDEIGFMIAGVVVTTLVFALAHAWAHALGDTLSTRAPVDRRKLLHSLRREWSIVEAAAPATIVLVLGALGLYSAATALWIAVLLNVTLMFVWGVGLRQLSGGNSIEVLTAGLTSASLGFLLVLLKLLVH